jgi:hypothetical protein
MTASDHEQAAVLRDPVLDAEFRERGLVILPFLDPDEVAHLRAAYADIAPGDDHGLAIDYMRPDRTYMTRVAELLEPIWARHFPEVFVDRRPILTTFITKHPGEQSNMYLHDDRTYVDERRERAGSLWVPLVDTGPNTDNGQLFAIPGSHRFARAMSGTGTEDLFRPFAAALEPYLVGLTVPAGHAAFYDCRTLHTSPPNRTGERRSAVACAVVPADAQLVHIVATNERHRVMHGIDDQFFLDIHPHTIDGSLADRYPVIDEFDDDSSLTIEDIVAVLGPPPAPPALQPVTVAAAASGSSATGGARRLARRVASWRPPARR